MADQSIVNSIRRGLRIKDMFRKNNMPEFLKRLMKQMVHRLIKVSSLRLAVLGQVAGSVGHELRNPLGVMSNAVYFLQTVLTDADDSVKEYLNIIKSEIAGSERIVSDLLDAVRTQRPHREIVGVAELIGQTLRKCCVKRDIITLMMELYIAIAAEGPGRVAL